MSRRLTFFTQANSMQRALDARIQACPHPESERDHHKHYDQCRLCGYVMEVSK